MWLLPITGTMWKSYWNTSQCNLFTHIGLVTEKKCIFVLLFIAWRFLFVLFPCVRTMSCLSVIHVPHCLSWNPSIVKVILRCFFHLMSKEYRMHSQKKKCWNDVDLSGWNSLKVTKFESSELCLFVSGSNLVGNSHLCIYWSLRNPFRPSV